LAPDYFPILKLGRQANRLAAAAARRHEDAPDHFFLFFFTFLSRCESGTFFYVID
jgi:hypothetical protein